ncbi:MAG: hypothetical protein KAJ09_04465 [Deltaproteobacteria bacterium]|nr:hypothetical protein [Deltaproteobacteria bacterium]
METDIKDVQSTLGRSFEALKNVCSRKSPLGFLCVAALIDYLSRLAYGRPKGSRDSERYIKFIEDFFPAPYRNFQYKNGEKDLPQQMYYVLRNGMVHSFTLVPIGKGRINSIVLCHRREAKRDGYFHLRNYKDKQGRFDDAVLFVMEEFLEDTKTAAYRLIKKANKKASLRKNILDWYTKNPPVTGGFKISLVSDCTEV